MYTSTSIKYQLALLLSLTHASYIITMEQGDGVNDLSFAGAADGIQQEDVNTAPQEHRKPADHFKHALTAGLIKVCETHHLDERNANVYAPTEESTFSSTVNTNGDGLLERLQRIGCTAPTITITSTTQFAADETAPLNHFKRTVLKFAENPDLNCTRTAHETGSTVTCSIVLDLQEFYALKRMYTETSPS